MKKIKGLKKAVQDISLSKRNGNYYGLYFDMEDGEVFAVEYVDSQSYTVFNSKKIINLKRAMQDEHEFLVYKYDVYEPLKINMFTIKDFIKRNFLEYREEN